MFWGSYVAFQNQQNFGAQFLSLLYGTSNTKFQNDFLEHVFNVCGLHKQEKRMGQKCQKK
jgi:hypothetical protein